MLLHEELLLCFGRDTEGNSPGTAASFRGQSCRHDEDWNQGHERRGLEWGDQVLRDLS